MQPRCSKSAESAFSLAELLLAMAISLSMAAVAFHLFHTGERVVRDQAIILEMQQTARLVASQINDDIRIAGQGIPPGLTDVLLPGSGESRLNLRSGFTATESIVTSGLPLSIAVTVPLTVSVESTSGFSVDRQAFLWAETDWVRVTIDSVSGSARTVRLIPFEMNRTPLTFSNPFAISTDEGVTIYRDAGLHVVKRSTTTNTSDAANPAWAPANELATNVTALSFLYYDESRQPLLLDTAEQRSRVRVIEARLTIRASTALSTGSRPTYSLLVRSSPRNLGLE